MLRKIILLLILAISAITNTSAQYANLGSGDLKSYVWWFNWNGFSLVNGASRDFTTDDGLQVKITFSQVSGPSLAPRVMDTWSGAVLHYLYDFSDPATMPALYNLTQGEDSYFTMTITATREGQPVPFTFLAADAEGSLSPVEYTTFTTSGGNWSFLDFFRNSSQTGNPVTGCGTQQIVITDTHASPDGSPVGQNPLMATIAPANGTLTVDVKMERTVPGGMGVAFGVYAPLDRGDLPAGYGYARHLLKFVRSNGCNFNPPFPALTQDESLRLGSRAGDADGADNTDDNLNGVDEDAVTTFPDYTGNGIYSLQLPLANITGADAWLTGSFDYNRNGVFDVNEAVTVVVPPNATVATLNWTGLPAKFTTGTGGLFAFRFRLSSNRAATQDVSIAAEDGEVEDYMTRVNSPCTITTNPTASSICAGSSVQLLAGGSGTYSWSPSAGLSDATIAGPIASPTTTTDYEVTVEDAGGCGGKASVRVVVNDMADVVTRVDTTVCIGNPVQLTTLSDNGTTFSWTPVTGLNNADILSPVATPTTTTRYTVTADNGTGCISQSSVLISVLGTPMSVTPGDTAVCEGTSLTLQATGGDTYEWLENGIVLRESGNAITISPDQTTIYSVNIVNNTCGANENFVIPVNVHALPATAVTSTNDIDCSHGSSMLLATGGTSYVWDTVAGISDMQIANPVVAPTTTTTYYVTITDDNKCVNRDSITVSVDLSAGLSVYPMPSAFTPNGDGKNDCFGLKYWGGVRSLAFSIYDRWGTLVFSSQDAGACWDGTFKGVLQPVGSYVYYVKAKTLCGEVERKGVVTLVQ
ncbi:CshA/CshB family fibrillar adhesin-related protein [Chitinophaga filiformis]|uniref:CshA/CshB family fibrillar adhesin-related protein n=1 Tax=Chitinophaga filiformis TaxID=104663 RepID=UPI001F48A3BA|nr:CshA/CshB family fibrillar adhesin-related protein [Chitinophaga filiformis]MCF6402444.1 CshA/CshB family fibrillar adhesin-related protein [Chitinophaga filiformis]